MLRLKLYFCVSDRQHAIWPSKMRPPTLPDVIRLLFRIYSTGVVVSDVIGIPGTAYASSPNPGADSGVESGDPSGSDSKPGGLSSLCDFSSCRNGECYVVGQEAKCLCLSMFQGDRCQYLNMDDVTHTVIGGMAIFQWPQPPHLKGYSFIYYDLDDPEGTIYTKAITMMDDQNSAIVGNLRDVHAHYRVCIEENYLANQILANNAVEYLTNCVNVVSEPDYHTVAAWILAIIFCCVVATMVYCQRDKFELLYFSKPNYLYCPALDLVKPKSSSAKPEV